jgi:hypothetical protein
MSKRKPPSGQSGQTKIGLADQIEQAFADQKAAVRAFLHWENKKGKDAIFDPSRIGCLSDVERALRDYWEAAE